MAESDDERKGWRDTVLILLVLAVLASLLAFRANYGMEWYGDEANALDLPMRYVAGDHPIVDSWETQFSSGMLLTPLVWGLEKFAPDNRGIILDFRYMFVALQVLYAFAVWRLVLPLVRRWWAAAISMMVGLYLPYFYLLLYYNTMAVAAFTLAALTLLRGFSVADGTRRRFILASGALSGVGVIAYPTMLLALPFFAAAILGECRARKAQTASVWRALGDYAGGAGIVLVIFLAVALWTSGMRHLAEALPNFAAPADRDFSLGAVVSRFWRTKSVMIMPALAATTFVFVHLLSRRSARRLVFATSAAIAVSVLGAAALYHLRVPWLSYLDMPQACALAIGTVVPMSVLAGRGTTSTKRLLRLLCLPALGVASGTVLASLEGFETASMPAIIAAIATLVALAGAVGGARHGDSGGTQPSPAGTTRLSVAVVALLLLFFVYGSTQYVAGDAPVRQLETVITSGPYEGIHTTRENAELYAHYEGALVLVAREPGRIAFIEEFPLGYLLTGRRPGTYSVWTTFAAGDRWQRYLDITGNYPTTIVSTTFIGPNGGLAPSPFSPPFGLRDFTSKYREVSRTPEFVVYESARARRGQQQPVPLDSRRSQLDTDPRVKLNARLTAPNRGTIASP